MRTIASIVTVIALAVVGGCSSSKQLSDGSMLGTMTTQQVPLVMIDGQSYRLAPGARIVGANNSSVTPNQVPPNSKVRYRVDASGQITQVWILPPQQ